MPTLKSLIITIILSLIIAGAIFYFTKPSTSANVLTQTISSIQNKPTSTPSPTPKPTFPPLDSTSNLSTEINQLQIPDYSQDFQTLKNAANNL